MIVHGSKILRAVDNPLFTGWEPVSDITVVNEEPKFRWKGSKIPYAVWAECVGFMRWTQEEFKEESLITFFYNTRTNTWAAWAFPQEPNGMTVRSLQDHPLYVEDRKRFGGDWIQFGSLHHHCTAGAFASGTDKDDEKDRDGIHITLGKLDEKTLDVHCRQTFEGTVSSTKLLDWVEVPDWLKAAPIEMQLQFGEFTLRHIGTVPFPKEWEDRVMERTFVNPHHTPHHWQQPSFQQGRRKGKGKRTPQTILGQPANTSAATAEPTTTSALTTTPPITEGLPPKAATALELAYAKLNDWELRMCAKIKEVLARLALSPKEAHDLLSSVPTTNWAHESVEMRSELVRSLNREGIPHLYSEDLCKKLSDIEASLPAT